jgi:hypothetical protein
MELLRQKENSNLEFDAFKNENLDSWDIFSTYSKRDFDRIAAKVYTEEELSSCPQYTGGRTKEYAKRNLQRNPQSNTVTPRLTTQNPNSVQVLDSSNIEQGLEIEDIPTGTVNDTIDQKSPACGLLGCSGLGNHCLSCCGGKKFLCEPCFKKCPSCPFCRSVADFPIPIRREQLIYDVGPVLYIGENQVPEPGEVLTFTTAAHRADRTPALIRGRQTAADEASDEAAAIDDAASSAAGIPRRKRRRITTSSTSSTSSISSDEDDEDELESLSQQILEAFKNRGVGELKVWLSKIYQARLKRERR